MRTTIWLALGLGLILWQAAPTSAQAGPALAIEFNSVVDDGDECIVPHRGSYALSARAPIGDRMAVFLDVPLALGGIDTALGCNRYGGLAWGNPLLGAGLRVTDWLELQANVRWPLAYDRVLPLGRGFATDPARFEAFQVGSVTAGVAAAVHGSLREGTSGALTLGVDYWHDDTPWLASGETQWLARYGVAVTHAVGVAAVGAEWLGRISFVDAIFWLQPGLGIMGVWPPPHPNRYRRGDKTAGVLKLRAATRIGALVPSIFVRWNADDPIQRAEPFGVGVALQVRW